MKIIVGLGNPGLKYAGTRHNTGFSALIGISDKFDIPVNKKQCKALVGHGFIADEKVVLAMPQSYMNLSGESVSELLNFYKCTPDDLIVLYDDVDLDVGVIRLRGKGSAGGHNGIKSIIELIGTDTFNRVKIGVGHKPEDCVKYAAATGACCVEAYDALGGLKSFEELDKKIEAGWQKN